MQNSFSSHIRLIILCPIRRHEIRAEYSPLPRHTRYADVLITLHCSAVARNRWRIPLNFNSRLITQLITQSRSRTFPSPSSFWSRNSHCEMTRRVLIRPDTKKLKMWKLLRRNWKFRTVFLSTKHEILLICIVFFFALKIFYSFLECHFERLFYLKKYRIQTLSKSSYIMVCD